MRKSLLLLSVLLLILVGLRWNSAPFFAAKAYRCIQVGALSNDYFSSITTNVDQLFTSGYSAHAIIDQLKKQFPVLNKIVVSYHPLHVRIMMYAHKPVCCINDALVLTANNELFPKNSFSDNALAAMVHVAVAQESMPNISSLLSPLLQELPAQFDQSYDLEFINKHCIYLTDKKAPYFKIVSCADQKKLSALLDHCALVKRSIDEQKGFNKAMAWMADTRFADYIVLYPMLH